MPLRESCFFVYFDTMFGAARTRLKAIWRLCSYYLEITLYKTERWPGLSVAKVLYNIPKLYLPSLQLSELFRHCS